MSRTIEEIEKEEDIYHEKVTAIYNVECRRCEVVNKYTEFQDKILEFSKNNPDKIIITSVQEIGKY